jgi:hypothetical protein
MVKKFADLRLADWKTIDMFGFAIYGITVKKLRICDLRSGTAKTFADL